MASVEPSKPKSQSCWLFHLWLPWHDIDARQVNSPVLGGTVGMAIKQERRCLRCNQVQLRTEKTTL